jgi:hypothetical protein
MAHLRTAKPCGPGTRGWCQVGGGLQSSTGRCEPLIRRRRRQEEFVSGERRISRQTIAQGRPDAPADTCMLVCVLFAHVAHETAGASQHPAFPAPSDFWGLKIQAQLGRNAPRGRETMSIHVIARSKATKQSILPLCRKMDCFASLAMTTLRRVGKGALAPCPPSSNDADGGHAALCPPYILQ